MASVQNAFARLNPAIPADRSAQSSMPIRPARLAPSSVGAAGTPQNRQASPRTEAFLALPQEPEDARLTGGTRSLDRRLLALNVSGTRRAAKPASRDLSRSA